MEIFARQCGTKEWRLIEVGVESFLLKYFIKFVTEGLVFQSPDDKYPMQRCMDGYATNINNIQSWSGWDIQQGLQPIYISSYFSMKFYENPGVLKAFFSVIF